MALTSSSEKPLVKRCITVDGSCPDLNACIAVTMSAGLRPMSRGTVVSTDRAVAWQPEQASAPGGASEGPAAEAGAIMAGLPYKCATSQADSFTCMSGRSQSADAWAALVPAVSAASAPRVSIWQGDADYTVRPTNLQELVKQWTKVNGVPEKPDATTTEGRATHQLHHDANGVVRVESWTVSKMGHGIALAHICARFGLAVGLVAAEVIDL